MSATSPRRSRRRPCNLIEPLEGRTLLSVAQPLATPSSFTVVKERPLVAAVDRTYLSLDGMDIFNGQATWTTDDATLTTSYDHLWLVYHQATTNGFLVDFQTDDPASPHYGHFQFALPTSVPVGPVSYSGIRQYGAPFGDVPNMDLSIDGRSNNAPAGNFTIRRADVDASGNLTHFAIDFGQYRNVDGTLEWHMPANALPDGTSLTLSVSSAPAHGALSFGPDGSFTYTPDPGFVGTDTFTYTASDGTATSAPVAATLHVLAVNQPPTFTKGADVTVPEDAGARDISGWATGLSPGATPDDAGQSLSFSVTGNTNPSLFSQAPSIDAVGRLTFTPAPDANGSATVTVVLHDTGGTANGGQDTSASQTFTINVTPVDDAPVAQDFAVPTIAGQPVSGQVHFTDIDGPSVSVQVVTPPAHGSLTLTPSGAFTYTPAAGFSGSDAFQFAANDGTLSSSPATMTVVVQPPPMVQFTGHLYDVYPQANGANTTPIAGRPVFDDANGNGVLDAGEAVAFTDFSGTYALSLPAGTHTIRPMPKPNWITPAGYRGSVTADASAPTGLDLYTTMATPVVIDVLAVHSNSFGPSGVSVSWDVAIRDAFQIANWIFANSDTNVRLRLLTIDAVNYTPANDLSRDLARLVKVGDGALDAVPKRRDAVKADLAILFDPIHDAVREGIAPRLDPAHPDASRGYAVVAVGASASDTGFVLAHEIGHTLGADHDLQNSPTAKLAYAHGYRFTARDGNVYRDVMAYAPGTQLPFFSTPAITFRGHALGDPATADVTRVVRDNAYIVAGYRGAAVFPPSAIPATAVAVSKAPASPGATVSATVKVRNNFVSKFSGNVSVAYYLSADRALDTSDILLTRKTVSVKNLNPRSTLSTAATFKVPAATRAGSYYVLAVATAVGQPADPRIAATTAAAALKVVAPPKKKTSAKILAAGFQSARPIVERSPTDERSSDDADDVITGLLISSA